MTPPRTFLREYVVSGSHSPLPEDFLARFNDLVASNCRADAVSLFLKRVGVPAFGQTHMVKAKAQVPALVEFFNS